MISSHYIVNQYLIHSNISDALEHWLYFVDFFENVRTKNKVNIYYYLINAA